MGPATDAGVPARRVARVRCTRPPKYGPGTPQVTRAAATPISRHRRGHPNGSNPGDVWSIPTRPYNGPHFAAYPIDLPLRCIAAGCMPGGTVLDPFTGSGTTGLAAIQLGRRFTGIDISPDFAQLAAGRLAQAVADKYGGRAMTGNCTAEITTRNDIARDIIAGYAAVTPHTGRHLAPASTRRSPTCPPYSPNSAVPGPNSRRSAWTARTSSQPSARPSQPTPRAKPTRSATCATNSIPPMPQRTRGGGHEHLPADPQADPPRPQGRPATHRRHRQPVPRACRGTPGSVRMAVPFGDRARRHGGRGPRGRLVAPPRHTPTCGRGCSPPPTWPRSRSPYSVRALAWPGWPSGSTRRCAVLMGGGWLAVVALLGPFASPMPQVLGVGAFMLSVPWWAHRRRRARARVQRALAAWPDISKAIALPGSKIQSATVDLWGWRAWVKLARGQTLADVTARIPAIESALGAYRGAVRVYPTRDSKANRCELRVLDTDPHAEAIPWPGPSAQSIAEPVDLGPFEDAEVVPHLVPAPGRPVRRHYRVRQERRTQRPHGYARRV